MGYALSACVIQEPTKPNSLQRKEDTSGPSSGCTIGCTSEGETGQADPLAVLAAALLGLSAEDRARLAAMLLAKQEGQ
jgi:hypothetical protein